MAQPARLKKLFRENSLDDDIVADVLHRCGKDQDLAIAALVEMGFILRDSRETDVAEITESMAGKDIPRQEIPETSADDPRQFRIAIVRFDSTNRIGQFGVPCMLLFGQGQQCVVTTQKPTKRNQWAKVIVTEPLLAPDKPPVEGQPLPMCKAELVEILGPVGDFATELLAYQIYFQILPCRYPKLETWDLLPAPDPTALEGRIDCTHLSVLSIDNASTRDIDDALSFEFADPDPAEALRALSLDGAAGARPPAPAGRCRIGIHVADVACRVPAHSPLFEWARVRAASAYHHGPGDDDHDAAAAAGGGGGGGGGSVPMMPPQLAHGALSLAEGQPRAAVTLWLDVDGGRVVARSHARTLIVNRNATTCGLALCLARSLALCPRLPLSSLSITYLCIH
jgi:hypothetical protein